MIRERATAQHRLVSWQWCGRGVIGLLNEWHLCCMFARCAVAHREEAKYVCASNLCRAVLNKFVLDAPDERDIRLADEMKIAMARIFNVPGLLRAAGS